VEGAAESKAETEMSGKRVLEVLLDELPLRQAVEMAARITGGRKNELYRLALAMRKKALPSRSR